MKTSTLLMLIMTFIVISLSSCDGSTTESEKFDYKTIQLDANKLANLQCKVMQLVGEALEGNQSALMESEKINVEAEKVSRELKDKYTSEVDQENFALAYEEALGNCN